MKFVRRYWRYVVSTIAFTMLVLIVGPRELTATLREARLPLVAAFALGFAATPAIYGIQLYGTFRILGNRVDLPTVMRAAVSSWSIGLLTPARTGDLTLAFFMRPQVPGTMATAVVIVDKLLGLLFLAAVAVVTTYWLGVPFAPAIALAALVVATSVLLLVGAAKSPRVSRMLARLVPSRVRAISKETTEAVRELTGRPDYLSWTMLMVTSRWLVLFGLNMVLFRAVNTDPPFGVVAAATSVGRLVALLPISVGGIGIKEPFQILIYESASVPAEAVVAASALGLASAYLAAAFLPLLANGRAREAGAS